MTQTMKLTTKIIDGFDNKGKDTTVWDTSPKGFGVRFYAKGKVAFIVQRRIGSGRSAKLRKMTIGSYPAINLVQARKNALEAIAQMQSGSDLVQQERDRIKAEAATKAAELSISELCDKWLATDAKYSRMRGARYGTPRNPKNVQSNANQILRHIKPLIGDIKIGDLTKKDIQQMRDDITTGKTATDVKTKKRGRARNRWSRNSRKGRSNLIERSKLRRP